MELKGKRVAIRPMTREEYHEQGMKYIPDPIMDTRNYKYDKKKIDKAYERVLDRFDWYKTFGIFVDNEVIGEISLKRIDLSLSRCEIGIALSRDEYKGKGYGIEAIELTLTYAQKELGIKNIYGDTMGTNYRMQGIFERLGFELLGVEVNKYDMGDRLEDKLDYVLRIEDRL